MKRVILSSTTVPKTMINKLQGTDSDLLRLVTTQLPSLTNIKAYTFGDYTVRAHADLPQLDAGVDIYVRLNKLQWDFNIGDRVCLTLEGYVDYFKQVYQAISDSVEGLSADTLSAINDNHLSIRYAQEDNVIRVSVRGSGSSISRTARINFDECLVVESPSRYIVRLFAKLKSMVPSIVVDISRRQAEAAEHEDSVDRSELLAVAADLYSDLPRGVNQLDLISRCIQTLQSMIKSGDLADAGYSQNYILSENDRYHIKQTLEDYGY